MTRSLAVRRTLAVLALAPLLLTGVAACGSDGTTATDSSSAAALSGLSQGDRVPPGDFVDTVADGVRSSTTAHLTMKVAAGATGDLTAEGDVDYTGDAPEMAMTMEIPAGGSTTKADIRLVDGILYMSMGQMTGGKFVKVDPADESGPMGGMGDLGGMLDQMDPTAMLEKMRSSVRRVTFEGDDAHGAHYVMTIDTAEMARSMHLPAEASGQLPSTLSYDLWLDEESRLSRMTMDLPVAGATASIEMNASDWGEPVSIEAPPASEVTEMPGMQASPSV